MSGYKNSDKFKEYFIRKSIGTKGNLEDIIEEYLLLFLEKYSLFGVTTDYTNPDSSEERVFFRGKLPLNTINGRSLVGQGNLLTGDFINVGSSGEIPISNSATNQFDYSQNFTWINGEFTSKGSGNSQATNNFVLKNSDNNILFNVTNNSYTGINRNQPRYHLDVNGLIAARSNTNTFISQFKDTGSAVTLNALLGEFGLGGALDSNSTNYPAAIIQGGATENWSRTQAGAQLSFSTTPNGTLAKREVLILQQDGNALFNFNVTASQFIGDGSGLTNLTTTEVLTFGTSGQIPYTNATGDDYDYGNISFSGNTLNIDGNSYTPLRFTNSVNGGYSEIAISGAYNQGFEINLDAGNNSNFDVFRINLSTINAITINRFRNLGIGTTTPDGRLHVQGSDNTTGVNTLLTSLDRTELFKVLNNGNVGIGNTSPSYKLDVIGDIRTQGWFYATSQGIRVKNGSAASPTLGFADDGDMGIYRITTNTLGFSTAAVERMRIDSSGNIGIGTTSPTEALDVVGTVKTTGTLEGFSAQEGTVNMRLMANAFYGWVGTQSAHDFLFMTNFNARAFLKHSTGNFTIGNGVTDLGARLGVKGSDNTTGVNTLLTSLDGTERFKLLNDGSLLANGISTLRTTTADRNQYEDVLLLQRYVTAGPPYNGNGNAILWKGRTYRNNNHDNPHGRIKTILRGDSVFNIGTDIIFENLRTDDATSLTESLRISYEGNIGIGTTSPTEKLHTMGDALFEGLAYSFKLSPNEGTGPEISLGTLADPTSFFRIGAFAGRNNFDTRNRNFNIFSNSIPSILFLDKGTGNVGIGTTSPTSRIHAQDGTVAEFKFNSGQSSVTPTLAVGNTNASGKYAALVAGTSGAGLEYDSTGFFSIGAGDKSRYNSGTLLGGTAKVVLRNDNLTIGNGTTDLGARLGVKGSDNTTGVNTLLTSANGTELVNVLNNGNVGIGTTTPQQKLSVLNTNSNPGVQIEHTAAGFVAEFINTNQYGLLIHSDSTSSFHYLLNLRSNSGNNDVMYVRADGNVGIGTTTPTAKLHVVGSDNTTGVNTLLTSLDGTELFKVLNNGEFVFKMENTSSTSYIKNKSGSNLFTFRNDANRGILRLHNGLREIEILEQGTTAWIKTNTGDMQLRGAINAIMHAETGDAIFKPNGTEIARFTSTGLGIGTTSPGKKLDVIGTVRSQMTPPGAGNGDVYGFNIHTFVGNNNRLGIGLHDAGDAFMALMDNTGVISRIDSNGDSYLMGGNVGIGTTSPTSKLQVVGADNTTGVNTLLTSLDGTELFKVLNNGRVEVSNNSIILNRTDVVGAATRNVSYAQNGVTQISAFGFYESSIFRYYGIGYDFKTTAIRVNLNKQVIIGGANSQNLPFNSTLNVIGSGSTSSTTNLLLQNSSGTELFKVVNDGTATFSNGTYSLAYTPANSATLYSAGSAALSVGTPPTRAVFFLGSRFYMYANNQEVLRGFPSASNCVSIGGSTDPTETLDVGGAKGSLRVRGISKLDNGAIVGGLSTYANNAAAIIAGLTAGALYIRIGHGLDIVT